VLTCGTGRAPRLTVSSRFARLACDVYADEGWYWSGEPAKLAPLACPASAARDLAHILGRALAASFTTT
jgi:hypothetical protein